MTFCRPNFGLRALKFSLICYWHYSSYIIKESVDSVAEVSCVCLGVAVRQRKERVYLQPFQHLIHPTATVDSCHIHFCILHSKVGRPSLDKRVNICLLFIYKPLISQQSFKTVSVTQLRETQPEGLNGVLFLFKNTLILFILRGKVLTIKHPACN